MWRRPSSSCWRTRSASFSNRADETVTAVISQVLNEFSDRLEFTDWTQMTESGNINAQISQEIMRARFGICYLSEPMPDAPDEGVRYMDNLNVVFEAGMIHARTTGSDAAGGEPTGW